MHVGHIPAARSRRPGLAVAGGRLLRATLDLAHLIPQEARPRLKRVQAHDEASIHALLEAHRQKHLVLHLGEIGRLHAVRAHPIGQEVGAHVRLGHLLDDGVGTDLGVDRLGVLSTTRGHVDQRRVVAPINRILAVLDHVVEHVPCTTLHVHERQELARLVQERVTAVQESDSVLWVGAGRGRV